MILGHSRTQIPTVGEKGPYIPLPQLWQSRHDLWPVRKTSGFHTALALWSVRHRIKICERHVKHRQLLWRRRENDTVQVTKTFLSLFPFSHLSRWPSLVHTGLILLIKKELKMNYKSKKLIILIVKDILCFTCSPFCSSLFFFHSEHASIWHD